MGDKRIMVIRTNDEEKDWLWRELESGRLRQGWGITGMQLEEDGKFVSPTEWEARYCKSAKEIWGGEPSPGEAYKRFRILNPMINLAPGDLVVIPKMPTSDGFIIAPVRGKYWFDSDRGFKDFSHVIPVDSDLMKKIPYSSSKESKFVVKKLRGYQRAVNNVWDKGFAEAIEKCYTSTATPKERDIGAIYSEIREPLIQKSLHEIRKLPSRDLEKLVEIAFEEAGYNFEKRNHYDNKGGDADLVFSRKLPLVSEISELALTVFVQIKQKDGKDFGDIEGVKQLDKISANNPQSVKILISTADEFSDACKLRASEDQVTLVSGLQAAELLMRYL